LLLQQDSAEAALPHLQAAVGIRPDDAFLHYSLGVALARLGRKSEAISAHTEAMRLDPANGDARAELERLRALP
jgi:Flp pilus assembly protein TadD